MNTKKRRIMIFLEGTIFYTRPILFLFSKYGYQPIKKAVKIVNQWYEQGDEILLISYVQQKRLRFIESIVKFYGLKYNALLCRNKGESYASIVEKYEPDILIEDDCKSIGGIKQCCITNVKPDIKNKIDSIIVPEFQGIDHIKIGDRKDENI